MINAGYAIWREAIADIMADTVISENATTTLALAHEEIQQLNHEITISNPSSKKAMSLVIAYIMISAEVAGTTSWTVAEKRIRQSTGFTDPLMYGILKLVFDQLHISPFWTITPDFIIELGQMYLSLLSMRTFRIEQ